MDEQTLKVINDCSKDDEAFERLKEVYHQLEEEKNTVKEHLQLLESAIKNDYDSIIITELDLEKPGPRIVYVNDGFCKMTGYSKEEVIGKTPRILQGPKTDRETLDLLKKRLREGRSFFGQTINYRKDGSEFVNQWDIHPLTNKDGEITHWVSYQHDITERKRSERMFVDNQVEFDELDEESKRTLVDIDVQGNIAVANKAFREMVGYDMEELKKVKIWELLPKKYDASLHKRLEGPFNEEDFDNKSYKLVFNHKSGVPVQVEARTKLLKLKDQTLIRADIKNISMQKRIMEALKERNSTFANIFEKKEDFNYSVTRDEDGKIVFMTLSDNFVEITGFEKEPYLNKADMWQNLVHPDDHYLFEEHIANVEEGHSETVSYKIQTSEGDHLQIIDYAKPEWDSDTNKVRRVIGSVDLENTKIASDAS